MTTTPSRCGWLLRFLLLCGSAQTVLSECGWNVKYSNYPNEFKYVSTCDDEEYVTVTMQTLQEYAFNFPTANLVTFGSPYAVDWSWMDAFAADSSPFQGYQCKLNKYIAKLSTLFGGNCLFNLTTYLFEEYGDIDFYNLTRKFVDKYSLKFDIDIDAWPWLGASNTLQLCMTVESNIPGGINRTDDEVWLNLTLGKDFNFAFPKLLSCEGEVYEEDLVLDVQIENDTVEVCVTIPYCNGLIYYDPIITSNFEGTEDSAGLKPAEIAGIVIGSFAVLVCCGVSVWYFVTRKSRRQYSGLLEA
eukprot:CAMPEP_0202698410 /NCGR_PEP_ID=MMETSP1385-20130828/11702_1 /ASSEMBLY_ACC=CAM_ASM_000861 /TAXON_ID=933848 /ORGANISM="Elphidium margaritaceum" /LENGTH=300 /DNA_ID=CAMNT_0049355125 /DNA_START=30 /DNA_END=932 /DNA_ORIENTATION=-